MGFKSNDEVQNVVQHQFSEQQLLLTKQISSGAKEFLNEKTIIIEIISRQISNASPEIIKKEFISVYNETSGIYVIEFINESGVVTIGYPEENTPSGYNLYDFDQAWAFERARDRKATYITRPLPLLEGGLGAFIWTPVYNEMEFKGVVLAIIRISDISDRFLKNCNSSGEIYMMDDLGTVLYSNSHEYQVGKKYLKTMNNTDLHLRQIILDQMNGSEGTGHFFLNNTLERKLVAYSPIEWRNKNWSVAVVSPVSEVKSLVKSVYEKQVIFMGMAGGFIILGSFSIVLLISKWNRSLENEVSRKTGQLRESNKLLHKANKKLTELDKLKSDFLSMVSHELRTPLTSMKISSEFMLENDSDPAVRKELCEIMIRNIDRLTRMVNDILDTSRIESKKLKLKKEMVDLKNIIDTSIKTVEKESEKKGLKIKKNIPDNISKICADKDRIIQVLVNLLSNSMKFTGPGGNVEINVHEFEEYIEVQVKDDGIGISQENIDKIFTKFYQIDNTSSRAHGGSGLGLAITKGIVEAHGGNINVESVFGAGCIFSFTLLK